MRDRGSNRVLHGFSWSAAFMLTSRATAFVSVPLVLHGVGTRLYAVWVLAGSVVMIQSLFDLGVASAVVRFAAIAAASGSRTAVLDITRRALAFYAALSLAVAVPMWLFAGALVRAIPFLHGGQRAAGIVIVHWAAVAFGLTNITMVLAAALQGMDRVGASYRDQTIGWLLYLPLLIAGMSMWSHAQAIGLAWVGAFGLQLLLLGRSFARCVRELPRGQAAAPSNREMLSFGSRWQLSAWADFATFQIPRFVAVFGLTAADALAIDLAIRAAQLAVGPVMAFYPTVLPKSAGLLAREGIEGLRTFLAPYYSRGALALIAGAALCIPLEVPALAAWTGRSTGSFTLLVPALVLIGTVAHTSTGLFTSAQLARGEVRSVLEYKVGQLLLAALLLSIAAPLGLVPLALALCIALAVPAVAFNLRARRALGLEPAFAGPPARRRLATWVAVQLVLPNAAVWALESSIAPWPLLGVALLSTTGCGALAGVLLLRGAALGGYLAGAVPVTAGSAPSIADHLARK